MSINSICLVLGFFFSVWVCVHLHMSECVCTHACEFECVYTHICIYLCVCVCMCACTHACGGQSLTSRIRLDHSCTSSTEAGHLQSDLELADRARLTSQLALDPRSAASQAGTTNVLPCTLIRVLGPLNSSPHARVANAWPPSHLPA